MSSDLETHTAPAPYRFIDDGEAPLPESREVEMLAVEFYPSVEDFVHISQTHAKKYPLPALTKIGLQAFFLLNAVGVPAVLIYSNNFIAALAVFLVNIALTVFVVPSLVKTDYRRFYRHYFGDLENEVVRIELHPTGVACKHLADSSFYAWKNFTYLEETKDAILFYMTGGRGVAVRKNGFAYASQIDEFLAFARQRLPRQLINDASGNS